MIKIIRFFAITLIVSGTTLAIPFLSAPAHAGTNASTAACDALKATGEAECTGSGGRVQGVVKLAINILSFVAGVIAVIVIILSGLKFITSGGDANAISSARRSILYAAIGIVVVVLAQIFVRLVVSEAVAVGAPPPPPPTGGSILFNPSAFL